MKIMRYISNRVSRAPNRGFALIMAMIALVAMSLTAMALLRSVDTGNQIAGNVAFRQASSQAIDVGLEAAYSYLNGLSDAALNSDAGNRYYATMQVVDANDIPSVINWSSVPVVSTSGLAIDGIYTIKFVIERLCSVVSFSDDQRPDKCYLTQMDTKCLNNNPGSPSVCAATQAIYYRATYFVTGPRNTKSYAQSTFFRYPQ
jgi:type IV pilus assembly protein PilX